MGIYLVKRNDVYQTIATLSPPEDFLREWPSDISKDDLPYCIIEQNEGEYQIVLDEGKKAESQISRNIQELISVENTLMKEDVKKSMIETFGTSDESSANAFYQTWQSWVIDPSLYSGNGYVSHMVVKDNSDNVLFELGDPLNTYTKINDFGQSGILRAKQFGNYRQKRISEYIIKIKQIQGE